MKKLKGIILTLLILFILILFLGFKIKDVIKHPFIATNENISIIVEEGASLFNLLEELEGSKRIKNSNIIKLYIKGKKLDTRIKHGEYSIDENTSIEELVGILNSGANNKSLVKITIPEGYDIESIGEVLEKSGLISKEEFIQSCREYKLPKYIKANPQVRYALEGYLFPDTYDLRKGSSGKDIIDIMLSRFESVIKEVANKNVEEFKNLSTLVTLSSIVEKEARVSEDRPKIASVINNRLKKDMMLQIDATVLYAMGKRKERLYTKDLKIKSPYNTYNIKGLTPGPICSPGKASIEAALNPAETNYVFYVLEDSERHYFTDNYSDFLKAKERYKNLVN